MDVFINVTGQKLKIASNLKDYVDGSQDFIRFVFNFNDDTWSDMLVTAQFQQNGKAYNAYLNADNSAFLPAEITEGTCRLLLFGSKYKVKATTWYIDFKVDKNNIIKNASSAALTKTDYEKLVSDVANLISTEKEDKSNKTQTLSDTSTAVQYPSAKEVWRHLITREKWENKITEFTKDVTDTQYPSAKLVFDSFAEVNVLNFGAKGDGSTDDSSAIQSALDYALAHKVKTVYFPKKTYLIKSCLYYYGNMILKFEHGASLKRGSDSLRYLLANDIAPTVKKYGGNTNIRIVGATFDGNYNYVTNASNDNKCTLLNTAHASNIIIENCIFKNGNVWHLYEICASENIKVINCIFDGTSYGGTSTQQDSWTELLQLDADTITVASNGTKSYSYGATKNGTSGDRTGCKNIKIIGSKFITNGWCNAIGNHNTSGIKHSDIRIEDCIFSGGGKTGGYLDFDGITENVDICNNTFYNNNDDYCVRFAAKNAKSTFNNNRCVDYEVITNGYGIMSFSNTVNGVLNGTDDGMMLSSFSEREEGADNVKVLAYSQNGIVQKSFDNFAEITSGGTFTLGDYKVYKMGKRIIGEIKFKNVTGTSDAVITPFKVRYKYQPITTSSVNAYIYCDGEGYYSTGYITDHNCQIQTRNSVKVFSEITSMSVWIDYRLFSTNYETIAKKDSVSVKGNISKFCNIRTPDEGAVGIDGVIKHGNYTLDEYKIFQIDNRIVGEIKFKNVTVATGNYTINPIVVNGCYAPYTAIQCRALGKISGTGQRESMCGYITSKNSAISLNNSLTYNELTIWFDYAINSLNAEIIAYKNGTDVINNFSDYADISTPGGTITYDSGVTEDVWGDFTIGDYKIYKVGNRIMGEIKLPNMNMANNYIMINPFKINEKYTPITTVSVNGIALREDNTSKSICGYYTSDQKVRLICSKGQKLHAVGIYFEYELKNIVQ